MDIFFLFVVIFLSLTVGIVLGAALLSLLFKGLVKLSGSARPSSVAAAHAPSRVSRA